MKNRKLSVQCWVDLIRPSAHKHGRKGWAPSLLSDESMHAGSNARYIQLDNVNRFLEVLYTISHSDKKMKSREFAAKSTEVATLGTSKTGRPHIFNLPKYNGSNVMLTPLFDLVFFVFWKGLPDTIRSCTGTALLSKPQNRIVAIKLM